MLIYSRIRAALAAILGSLMLGACGGIPLGQNVPAETLHDIHLLVRYGTAVQSTALSQEWRAGLEREIQNRGLLTAQDVMIIQARKIQGGASIAATLSSLHFLPSAFGSSKRHPGVEVIVIGSGLYQAREPDMFFFHDNKLIGWYYTTMDEKTTNVYRSSQGRTFNIADFDVIPCQKLGDSPCSGLRIPRNAKAASRT